jgi:hypothetical protein
LWRWYPCRFLFLPIFDEGAQSVGFAVRQIAKFTGLQIAQRQKRRQPFRAAAYFSETLPD